ncbi:MAG TPA: PEP-CTERM sorting domain-containing protein [Luteolibacter sp.]|nr:PEP-CTERM sorting domain-containing protein [Luteolibacter sp.]
MKTKFFAAALIAFGLLAGAANAAVFRAVTVPGEQFTNNSWAFGTTFTVGTSNLSITSLGAYDAGLNGFSTEGGIKVGIFHLSSGLLLGSADVQSSDPLVGLYRYANASMTLLANQQYVLVAVSGLDPYMLSGGTWSFNETDINFTDYRYQVSSNLIMPSQANTEYDYGMGNFQYTVVPEPSSAILIGFGSFALAMRRRRI